MNTKPKLPPKRKKGESWTSFLYRTNRVIRKCDGCGSNEGYVKCAEVPFGCRYYCVACFRRKFPSLAVLVDLI